jgi:hypothetical protein
VVISPPPVQVWKNNLPVVALGTDLIIALHPPASGGSAHELDLLLERDGIAIASARVDETPRATVGEEAIYVRVAPLAECGTYRLRATAGALEPVHFGVTEPSVDFVGLETPGWPLPLSVSILGPESEHSFHAFADGRGPHQVPLSETASLVLTVQSLVPLNLSWRSGNHRRQHRSIAPDSLHECIAADLDDAILKGQRVLIGIDAGAFGAVEIELIPVIKAVTQAGDHFHSATRLRWLATTAAARSRQKNAMLLPLVEQVRQASAGRTIAQNITAFARLPTVPPMFAAHLAATRATGTVYGERGVPSKLVCESRRIENGDE